MGLRVPPADAGSPGRLQARSRGTRALPELHELRPPEPPPLRRPPELRRALARSALSPVRPGRRLLRVRDLPAALGPRSPPGPRPPPALAGAGRAAARLFPPRGRATGGARRHLALSLPPLWALEPGPRDRRAAGRGLARRQPGHHPGLDPPEPVALRAVLHGRVSGRAPGHPGRVLRRRVDRRRLSGPAVPAHHPAAPPAHDPPGRGGVHHPHVEDLHHRPRRLERRAGRREPRAVALHLPDRLPVLQDGARLRRIGLSPARDAGLHPAPAPPAPGWGPWLTAEAGPRDFAPR